MKKILFITNRNIIETCGELRLIKNRANALYEFYNISTDFVVCRKETNSSIIEAINKNFSITPFFFSYYKPWTILTSWIKTQKYILEALSSKQYSCVIFSGFIPTRVISVTVNTFPFLYYIYDHHGTIRELIEFNNKSFLEKILRRVAYYLISGNIGRSVRKVDGFFVVSKALKKNLVFEYNITDKQFFLVPCANSNQKIVINEQIEYREFYRHKYNIKNDEVLFVYSGGVSPWQCLDISIELFRKIKQINGWENSKFLILSGSTEKVRNIIGKEKGFILDSFLPTEIDKVLCSGDIAFLLRENFVTNNVAYPNKFLEYVRSGMYIIATEYIYDVAEKIKQNNFGYILENNINKLMSAISKRPAYGQDFEKREKLLHEEGFEIKLQPFVMELMKHEKNIPYS
ncbi:hypothetical protein SDC9_52169 [bioreactor metagenome]|uniref:Glycosyl transferase family 1 domain-containing protein n=1 Tax=bioreactor metagenome TaxID=1076179 RepID=A0A644WUX8_9ZZZZ